MYRTLIVLTLAQAFAMTAPPIVVLLGGIVGTRIAPSANLATLPVAFMIVGTALATVPAAMFMGKFGRKLGFISSAIIAALSGLLAAYAISVSHFWLFCLATLLVGSNNAFVQQYRFATAESVPADRVGKSLSILMLAGVAAAWMGPQLANTLSDIDGMELFSGSFIGLSLMMCTSILFLSFYRNQNVDTSQVSGEARSLWRISSQITFVLAVGAAAVAYGVMSLLMTATPVSMHTVDNFSLGDTSWVIQSHIMAMFLPSFFSGFLIDRLGARKIVIAGLAILCVCLMVAYMDRHLIHYWFALVLLGIGWNFLFLGGTTLLTTTYRAAERFKVQALNDFLVFSIQACAALGSGYLLTTYGWNWVVGFSVPWLIILAVLLLTSSRSETSGGSSQAASDT
ncbi:MAG: MFS transporter [Pseudomonadales bacterium]|nr:MFS transporter [Pseudomonadales bacterium]